MTRSLLDPKTGLPLEPLYIRADGRPVWPIMGGSEDADTADDPGADEDAEDSDESDKDDDAGSDEADASGPWDEERAKRDMSKKNRENASLRARLKEAEAAQQRLKELEREKMSDTERAQAEAKDASDELAKLRKENQQFRLLAEVEGLTPKLASRVQGDTWDEMLEDAKGLVSELGTKSDKIEKPEKKTPPAKSLRSGDEPDEGENDPDKLAKMITERSGRRFF